MERKDIIEKFLVEKKGMMKMMLLNFGKIISK